MMRDPKERLFILTQQDELKPYLEAALEAFLVAIPAECDDDSFSFEPLMGVSTELFQEHAETILALFDGVAEKRGFRITAYEQEDVLMKLKREVGNPEDLLDLHASLPALQLVRCAPAKGRPALGAVATRLQ